MTSAKPRRAGERARGARALLVSLLIHALLLSLTLGGDGLGLPGLGLPWKDRRTEAPMLRVQLAAPVSPASPFVVVDDELEPGRPTPTAQLSAKAIQPRSEPAPEPTAELPVAADADETPIQVARLVARPGDAQAGVARTVIGLSRPGESSADLSTDLPGAVAPTLTSASSPLTGLPPLKATTDTLRLREPASRERVLELPDLEQIRSELQQQAQRLETARQEAEQAARREAAQREAARQEAARREAAQQDAARAEAARAEAAKQDAAKAAEERRQAILRAIGQQLNEEAAQREAQRASGNLRRGRLFGRADANAELVLYAEAWARKIQLNPTVEMVRAAAQPPHTEPVITVAVRSDGSVESVTFVRSSGLPALDDAIRRVIASQERYAPFSPALARDYDVVEIRRTWHIDTAIRLY